MKKIIVLILSSVLTMTGLSFSFAATSTTNSKTIANLKYILEEEKLAYDVYAYYFAKGGMPKYKDIQGAELQHMNMVRAGMKAYGIKDTTPSLKAGVYHYKDLTAIYKKLTAVIDKKSPYLTGVNVEIDDIKKIDAMLPETTEADLTALLKNLKSQSNMHIDYFKN